MLITLLLRCSAQFSMDSIMVISTQKKWNRSVEFKFQPRLFSLTSFLWKGMNPLLLLAMKEYQSRLGYIRMKLDNQSKRKKSRGESKKKAILAPLQIIAYRFDFIFFSSYYNIKTAPDGKEYSSGDLKSVEHSCIAIIPPASL